MLRQGKVGVIPTDTIYGIVGGAFSQKAVGRIYRLKKRNRKKALIILIGGYEDLPRFGVRLTPAQKDFLKKVWSRKKAALSRNAARPVSVILPAPSQRFFYLHRGAGSLAFRMPKPPALRSFLKKTGPLVAPSANIEGLPPAVTILEAQKYFGARIDFYVDGGAQRGKASRLIDMTSGRSEILRK